MHYDNVFYFANYISQEVSLHRTSRKIFYAGNKRVEMVLELLKPLSSTITVLSPTFTSGKSNVVYDRTRTERSSDGKVTFIYPLALCGNILSFFVFIVYVIKLGLRTDRQQKNLIVVYNSFFYTIVPGLVMAKILRTKILLEYEDVLYSARDMHIAVRLFSFLFEKALMNWSVDAFINVNSYMPNVDYKRKPVFVLQGFFRDVQSTRKAFPGGTEFKQEKLRLLYAGTVHRNRGIFQFLSMLARTRATDKVQVIIVGPTKYDMASELQQYPFALYLGIVSEERLAELIQQADLCLVTQPIDKFALGSFPSKLFEYVMTGKPILSTPLPDAFRLKETGYPIFFYSTCDDIEYIFESFTSKSSAHLAVSLDVDLSRFTLEHNRLLFVRFLETLDNSSAPSTVCATM